MSHEYILKLQIAIQTYNNIMIMLKATKIQFSKALPQMIEVVIYGVYMYTYKYINQHS